MLNEVLKNTIIEQEIQIIYPSLGISFEEQLESCLNQVALYLKESGLNKWHIIKQTYFVDCTNNDEKKSIDKIITTYSYSFYDNFVPTSIIPEAPLGNYKLALELTIMPWLEISQPEIRVVNNIKYLAIKSLQGTYIIGCGLGEVLDKTDIYKQGDIAFDQMHQILTYENINFENVVRQWNYIEDIVGYTEANQHYQIFNDIRSAYYRKSSFSSGYPSATGIGMSCSGVIIDFIALVQTSDSTIIAVKSPVQADAHHYSNEVLAHNSQSIDKTNTTPKFERAKVIMNKDLGIIYVSGTAAIKGELSANQFDIKQQTTLTLDNIYQLVSKKNLIYHGISDSLVVIPKYFRIYIKNRTDLNIIRDIVLKNIAKIPILFVEADICRPELVVEVEGIFSLKYQ
jgi:enamine deaminase RidA (YjgF/YER057c/UK114 family)